MKKSYDKKIEILAPAGGADMVSAAVNCGANAVYLGFGNLNARKSAKNFTVEDLRDIVEYCHIRDVSVHLTLNTLVFDNELKELEGYIHDAANARIDAIIVQDLATAKLVKSICPSMPIHGSTQMSVNSVSGVKVLEQLGFDRVVLARELSKSEIKHIVSETNIETEIFVHGAHCMSVSGQCTMSAMIGQRSGNRGMCAQPCRLPFSRDESNLYGLSLKDMSIIYDLKEISDMGVTSVKIEGRMKRPEYVAAAVTACVASINGDSIDGHMDRLEKVFSRSGFTDGFYKNKIDSTMYGVRSKGDVLAAKQVLGDFGELYRAERQSIPVRFSYSQKNNKPVSLCISDNAGNSYTAEGDIPQIAINKPTEMSRVISSLEKLGGTPYYVDNIGEDIVCDIDDGLMVPVSSINQLRRDCIHNLSLMRLNRYKKHSVKEVNLSYKRDHEISHFNNLPKLRATFRKESSIDLNILEEYEYIYLPVKLAINMSQKLQNYKERVILLPPRAMFGKEKEILEDFYAAKMMGYIRVCAVNIGDFYWANNMGFIIHGGFGLNCVNSVSMEEYKNMGCVDMEMSLEIDLAKINKISSDIPIGIVAYGHVPLMLTRNCPGKSSFSCAKCSSSLYMTDRLGNKFMVSCGEYKTASEVFNCNPIYLGDKLSELSRCSFINLYFANESSKVVNDVTNIYKGRKVGNIPNITRGLLYRGIF